MGPVPVAEASELPSLLLSGAQLAVIADLAEVEPAWQWSHPRLDGEAQAAVAAGLRARGIIDADDALAAVLRPLLGVALHAREVVSLTSTETHEGGSPVDRSWAIAAPVAVEIDQPGPLLALTPLEFSSVLRRALALLGLPAARADAPASDGDWATLTAAQARAALAGEEVAGAAGLADAADAAPRRSIELRRDGQLIERITILGLGAQTWMMRAAGGGDSVRVGAVSALQAAVLTDAAMTSLIAAEAAAR